jgi:uncharacterized protein YggT (Ycf19 family)
MIAGLVNLAFQGLELVIVAGVILLMITQVARGPWTRHPLVKGLMLAARLCCAPVRRVMKGLGIPVAPLDFSPLLTLLLLRVVQWFVVGFLRLFP